MADALAAAYCQHKRGGDPEAALNADYSVNFPGLLYHEDLDRFRNSGKDGHLYPLWHQLRDFFVDGDRIVSNVSVPYDYYLLVRGDRLVWRVESIHKVCIGVSLKRKAEEAHFVALGGCKAFLNDEFTWPPPDWVNPVSNDEEAASLKKGFKKSAEYLAEADG